MSDRPAQTPSSWVADVFSKHNPLPVGIPCRSCPGCGLDKSPLRNSSGIHSIVACHRCAQRHIWSHASLVSVPRSASSASLQVCRHRPAQRPAEAFRSVKHLPVLQCRFAALKKSSPHKPARSGDWPAMGPNYKHHFYHKDDGCQCFNTGRTPELSKLALLRGSQNSGAPVLFSCPRIVARMTQAQITIHLVTSEAIVPTFLLVRGYAPVQRT